MGSRTAQSQAGSMALQEESMTTAAVMVDGNGVALCVGCLVDGMVAVYPITPLGPGYNRRRLGSAVGRPRTRDAARKSTPKAGIFFEMSEKEFCGEQIISLPKSPLTVLLTEDSGLRS